MHLLCFLVRLVTNLYYTYYWNENAYNVFRRESLENLSLLLMIECKGTVLFFMLQITLFHKRRNLSHVSCFIQNLHVCHISGWKSSIFHVFIVYS